MRAPKAKTGGWHWHAPDLEWLKYHYTFLDKPPDQIAREVGVSGNTVRTWLKNVGMTLRRGWRIMPPDLEWLCHQYWGLEKTPKQIALEVGVSAPTVVRWMEEAGIPFRTRAESYQVRDFTGEGNPNWRGGRWDYLHKQAQMMMLRAGVPRSCAICEVFAGFLGFLVVHHIDGDERNNDLENLQYLCNSCHRRTHLEMNKET